MSKNGYLETGRETIINTLLLTGVVSSASALASGDSLFPPSALVGLGGACALGLAQRNLFPGFVRRFKKPTSRFARLVDYSEFTIEQVRGRDKNTKTSRAKFRTMPMREFVYWQPKLLAAPVPESILAEIVTHGLRRQLQATHKTRARLDSSTGRHVRLNINQAVSREYFMKRRGLTNEQFDDATMILLVTGYVDNRSPGRAHRFLNVQLGVGGTLQGVQDWWLWLLDNSPPLSNAPAISNTFLPHNLTSVGSNRLKQVGTG